MRQSLDKIRARHGLTTVIANILLVVTPFMAPCCRLSVQHWYETNGPKGVSSLLTSYWFKYLGLRLYKFVIESSVSQTLSLGNNCKHHVGGYTFHGTLSLSHTALIWNQWSKRCWQSVKHCIDLFAFTPLQISNRLLGLSNKSSLDKAQSR